VSLKPEIIICIEDRKMNQQPIVAVKALKYTGKRQNDYQILVVVPRLRGIARNEVVNRLNKLEVKALKAKVKRDLEKANREAEEARLRRIEEARREAERVAKRKEAY